MKSAECKIELPEFNLPSWLKVVDLPTEDHPYCENDHRTLVFIEPTRSLITDEQFSELLVFIASSNPSEFDVEIVKGIRVVRMQAKWWCEF